MLRSAMRLGTRLAAMEIFVRVVDAGLVLGGRDAARRRPTGRIEDRSAQLEERLGVQLLVRGARGLTLTDAGTAFFENAKRAIDGVNQAESIARGKNGLGWHAAGVGVDVFRAASHHAEAAGVSRASIPDVDIEIAVD